MNICYYNWSKYDDKRNLGGGVNVYQKNLISNTLDSSNVFFISSGVFYNPVKKGVHYKRKGNNFTIINSNTLAPSHYSFLSEKQLNDNDTEDVFIEIIKKIGTLDIIHFNNLEGVPVHLLSEIKNHFPKVKIILSMHNYYPFCPQVNLWERESRNCIDFNDGKKCINCIKPTVGESVFKKKYWLDQNLIKINIKEGSYKYSKIMGIAQRANNLYWALKKRKNVINDLTKLEGYFSKRRCDFVKEINDNCDLVIAVSHRVKEISVEMGIAERKIVVSYIGTEHKKHFSSKKVKNTEVRTLCYLGYMRKDKGFDFFIDSMSRMDEKYAKKLSIKIAARSNNDKFMNEIRELTKKFNKIEYFNGYNHENIDSILDGVDLGIIPVLWEDNLPQVAIEMHCRRIPLLTSDLGGASELHMKNKNFTFSGGNEMDFLNKIYALVDKKYDILDYWNNAITPKSSKEHMNELLELYNSTLRANSKESRSTYI